eukprot:COSAG01_NODE_8365_length_2813_cov_1.606853_5_plen_53_part_00
MLETPRTTLSSSAARGIAKRARVGSAAAAPPTTARRLRSVETSSCAVNTHRL